MSTMTSEPLFHATETDNLNLFDLDEVAPKKSGPSEQVMEVWEFWIDTMRSRTRNSVKMSDKRRRKIEQAIKLYDVQTCKQAIKGCSMSDFHMGKNGSGTKYDDIELILRDAEHIENFRDRVIDRNDW